MGADAGVAHLFTRRVAEHLRIVVGQTEGCPGEADGHGVVGVEAEKPDAGLSVRRDVGSEVQLRKVRERGDARQAAGPHAAHAERHDAEPGAAVEGVQAQGGRYERTEPFFRDGPVHKEQVVPAHGERPGTLRQGVRAVFRPAQNFTYIRHTAMLG